MERFEIQGYQALGSGLLASIYRVLENWVFTTAVPYEARLLGTPWWRRGGLTDEFFGSVQYPKLLTLTGLKMTVAKSVSRGSFDYVMGAAEVGGKLVLGGRDSLNINGPVDADDIDRERREYRTGVAR